jgi:hypothetical protein
MAKKIAEVMLLKLKLNTFGLFNFLPLLALEVGELITTVHNFRLHERMAQEWISQAWQV